MTFALSCIWLALVVWLLMRAFRQRGALQRLHPRAVQPDEAAPNVAVIVPARDESANIEACLVSMLGQYLPRDRLHIVAVDDHSTDDTARIIERLAACDSRLTLLRAPALPRGWTGKVHACWAGALAIPRDVQWLCFLDADMRGHPLLLASAIGEAVARDLDLLSLAPRHDLRSFAERLMLPCGLYVLAFTGDLAKIQAPDSADAAATGQFMLIRHAAYAEVGGYAPVRNSICEDVELARLLKRSGHRVLMMDGSALLSARMYTGWRTLWPGIAKNLSEMLGGPVRTVITAIAAVAMAWAAVLLPIAAFAGCERGETGACIARIPALAGSAATFALHIAGAAHFRIPMWYGLLFPLGYSVGALIALDSVRWRLIKRVRWKGRVYP